MLGKFGATEIILIAIIFLILFGGKKIPEMMKGVGRGIKEFKDAMNKDYSKEEENNSTEEKESQPK